MPSSMEHKLRVMANISLGLNVGDLVTRRSGSLSAPAEIRGIFMTSRGKPMIVLEYPSQIFRVVRPQQLRKVNLS